uniref:Uncharacterized protein n=1 Tax=Arundo donax TaxID=35708 RepID=A0A0A9EWW8_ARUDO
MFSTCTLSTMDIKHMISAHFFHSLSHKGRHGLHHSKSPSSTLFKVWFN